MFNHLVGDVLVAVVLTGVFLCEASAQPGQWITRSRLPTARQEISHAVLNGKIYISGGLTAGGAGSSLVEVFTPATNSWSTIASMPEPLHHLGFVSANGKLYVLGGYTGSSFAPMNRTYVYLPDSNLWRRKADMPVARGAHIAVEFSGRIFLFGGITNVGDSRRTDLYDPQTDMWTNLAAMPTAREHLAAAAIDSLIYVVGGRIGSTNNNILEAYSPATNLWYTKASMPTARGGLAAASLRGRLYVFGGEIPAVYPQNEEYNPATNSWRTMAPMPTPRHGIGAATVGDSIFIIGGATVAGFGVTDVNQAFYIPPEITLMRPAGGDTLIAGTMDSVTWVSTLQIDSVRIEFTTTGIWQTLVAGIPNQNVYRYVVPNTPTSSGRFRVSWKRNGLVNDFTDPPFTISVRPDYADEKNETLVLSHFSLLQNCPNPFNPSTTIQYDLPRASFVKLSVYNLLGEEVRMLVAEQQHVGKHKIEFDAGNLTSGIYFYRIQTSDFVASRKMLLLK